MLTRTSPIPTVADLAADPVTHHYDDMIAPSGLTNHLGTVRVDHDLTSVSAVQFPPVSQALATTAVAFVDGRIFTSYGAAVTHEWRPDRVVRRAVLPGLELVTTTVAVPGTTAVAIDVRVRNTGGTARSVEFMLSLAARVVAGDQAWNAAESPDARNEASVDGERLVFVDAAATAWSVQGVDVPATARLSGVAPTSEQFSVGVGGMGRGGDVTVVLEVAAGAEARFGYVNAVGTSREQALAVFEAVAGDVEGAVAASEQYWNAQLEAAVTPGNTEFSGHLPVLETESEALHRLYWWGILGVIYMRRDYAGNVLRRSYDTLMPNYWATTTFIWDFSLSSVTHALLDPAAMKRQLSHWIASDTHTLFGTSSLTGGPVGQWYSVNDYAMTRLVRDYVRFTGDAGFFDEQQTDGRSVLDHLRFWARAWQGLRRSSTLADYGEIENLLECVSTYTHEVASFNAANVWNLRVTADVLDARGDAVGAAELRAEADELVAEVRKLYLPGEGFFAARQPDGSRLPVRHCYDFNIVGTTIAGDLDDTTRAEMVAFFRRELQTPEWLRALSPWDPDASYSVRPDHQWNGAYTAWPADAARSLVALGEPGVALEWLPGLSRSANQGPPAQAHFVEEAQPLVNGGARKAPPQLPYINDWACSSAGAYVALVIESLFGAVPGLDGLGAVEGCVAELDPTAVLRGLRVGERLVDVHADGRVVDRA
ncbi:hypothetical protein [Microbacterium kyungheense]|uniref:Uncharacterized protein n=1 Tax=Microbacterium kyungheense TaxID=1263636 RepID=A0A543FKJ9_9MICO|nr:hypothetical protein [Microbacterium kyungheense]TQM34224.1 hypothetical protein FB391_0511 [Microbacterium kyungheense]